MSLIDPIQMMTLMAQTPERTAQRRASQNPANTFHRQMDAELGKSDSTALAGGSPLENAFAHDAILNLSSLVPQRNMAGKNAGGRTSRQQPELGALSAGFESGSQGAQAIGYDQNGGTSYGTYQIASKPGSMRLFVDFLETRAPDLARKLKSAGPSNTGSTKGRMPDAWRVLAAQHSERFDALQREFIKTTHYEPARDKILANTGVDVESMPTALREALWSTAVQHGPSGAASIFGRAIKAVGNKHNDGQFAKKLITQVYNARKSQFGSSDANVQSSVQKRMGAEKEVVLAMLRNESQNIA